MNTLLIEYHWEGDEDGGAYVMRCRKHDVVAQGGTYEEALLNLDRTLKTKAMLSISFNGSTAFKI